ncbi:MAG: cation-transporting P-type ATPase [archaeon]
MEREGLSKKEAEKRFLECGPNEIKDTSKSSPLKIFLRQIKNNFIIYLLFFAMILSFFVGKSITAYTILGVIFLVILGGFVQEYRAEKAIFALKQMIMPVSTVIRDGREQEILSKEIVLGDLLILRGGEKIPADCIILEEKNLLLDESIITGESKEIKKSAAKNLESYNEKNIVFMGSYILSGKCIAKVIDTGMNTKFGKIANMISTAEKELPLQNKINKISKYMVMIALTMAFFIGVAIFFSPSSSRPEMIEILILIIAIAVSAFPEGFPVVLITTLSLGAYNMAKKKAIVNRISIIETLGETTVICSDKTGTITKGEMTVNRLFENDKIIEISGVGYKGEGDFFYQNRKIEPNKDKIMGLLLKAAILCNDSRIERTGEDKDYRIFGAPTEAALLVLASKANIFKENFNFKILTEFPFNSERKMMSVLVKEKAERYLYSKGALEILLRECKYIQRDSGVFRLLEKDREKILEENKKMTSSSLRTLGFAYKKVESGKDELIEKDLIFVGFAGIEDPPREEVKEAIEFCRKAGIKVKMITGDNKETAISIANQIGLDKGKVLDGDDLDKLSDKELVKIVRSIVIFARVRPEHKLRIVRALKEKGEIVTMTGDGVNDSPALKEAHIGVAMGKNGTDVSRSVADLVLKDDNFATIVEAIREGRTIFKNIRKFVSYQLSCNYAELSILFVGVLLAPLLGWPIPVLLALQILFMNLVTDNIPAITLGFNKSSEDIMYDKPRKNAEILNKDVFILLALSGTLMTLITLGVFYFTFNILNQTIDDARTTALVTLIVVEIASAFNFRSFRKGVLTRSLFVNKPLVYASLISIAATILIVYTPLNRIFGTVPIPLIDWIVAIGVSLIVILFFDLLKKFNNKMRFLKLE